MNNMIYNDNIFSGNNMGIAGIKVVGIYPSDVGLAVSDDDTVSGTVEHAGRQRTVAIVHR